MTFASLSMCAWEEESGRACPRCFSDDSLGISGPCPALLAKHSAYEILPGRSTAGEKKGGAYAKLLNRPKGRLKSKAPGRKPRGLDGSCTARLAFGDGVGILAQEM